MNFEPHVFTGDADLNRAEQLAHMCSRPQMFAITPVEWWAIAGDLLDHPVSPPSGAFTSFGRIIEFVQAQVEFDWTGIQEIKRVATPWPDTGNGLPWPWCADDVAYFLTRDVSYRVWRTEQGVMMGPTICFKEAAHSARSIRYIDRKLRPVTRLSPIDWPRYWKDFMPGDLIGPTKNGISDHIPLKR